MPINMVAMLLLSSSVITTCLKAGLIRCGAISCNVFASLDAATNDIRSLAADIRRPFLNPSHARIRYLRLLWISFVEPELVPEAKSPISRRTTLRPLIAASLATLAPATPPPMTATSTVPPAFSRSIISFLVLNEKSPAAKNRARSIMSSMETAVSAYRRRSCAWYEFVYAK